MHYPFYLSQGFGFAGLSMSFLLVTLVWVLVLKGLALWYAARAGQKWWFVALLVINTLGILEIVYLLFFRPGATLPLYPSKNDESVSSEHTHTHHTRHARTRHTHSS